MTIHWAEAYEIKMGGSGSALQTRPSLLLRIRDANDADAWRQFVNLYGPVVFRHCRRRQLQEVDATDVTQEVLLEVSHAIRKFEYRRERGRFRDWLWTLTNRKLSRFFAQQKRSHFTSNELDTLMLFESSEADSQWSVEFEAEVLRVAMGNIRSHFEPVTWQAFERAWLENCSATNVAMELGIPVASVYVAKSRVLKRLEEEVRSLAEDLPHVSPVGPQ